MSKAENTRLMDAARSEVREFYKKNARGLAHLGEAVTDKKHGFRLTIALQDELDRARESNKKGQAHIIAQKDEITNLKMSLQNLNAHLVGVQFASQINSAVIDQINAERQCLAEEVARLTEALETKTKEADTLLETVKIFAGS